jgi:hypothetical protein
MPDQSYLLIGLRPAKAGVGFGSRYVSVSHPHPELLATGLTIQPLLFRLASEMTNSTAAPTKHNLMTKAAVPSRNTKPSVAEMKAITIRMPE